MNAPARACGLEVVSTMAVAEGAPAAGATTAAAPDAAAAPVVRDFDGSNADFEKVRAVGSLTPLNPTLPEP